MLLHFLSTETLASDDNSFLTLFFASLNSYRHCSHSHRQYVR